jgi:YVTN family beta-propeller protein
MGRRAVAIVLGAFLLAAGLTAVAFAGTAGPEPTKRVIFVGNNWDGTATVIREQPRGRFRPVARINIVPDLQQRMAEITSDPVRLGYFLAIQQLIGEGHNQFVDDMYSTRDGKTLVVSRPSLADVVGIDLATDKVVWRFKVKGQRSDHMGVSPDGRLVAVSASTGNVVHVLNMRTGKEVWQFPSGDSPHENNFSKDGTKIFHASIGLVYTPADDPALDSTKGDRRFEIVDTRTHKVIRIIRMGQKLDQAGYPNMSAAVQPMALSPDERWVYFQVSFFHGFVEYNFARDKVTRVANLPLSEETKNMPRQQYVLDSAHHGIAMNAAGTRLCVAGTMDDYAAIVSRKSFRYTLIHGGKKPYWSTNTDDGKRCLVSWSGSDRISVINYRTRQEVARIPVGDHPQRVRTGNVQASWLRAHQAR